MVEVVIKMKKVEESANSSSFEADGVSFSENKSSKTRNSSSDAGDFSQTETHFADGKTLDQYKKFFSKLTSWFLAGAIAVASVGVVGVKVYNSLRHADRLTKFVRTTKGDIFTVVDSKFGNFSNSSIE